MVLSKLVSERMKVGLIEICFGVFFLSLGCFLFFDAALLALGNILIFIGIIITSGLSNITSLITDITKLPGTIAFIIGVYMVLIGYARIGIIIEGFGIFNLFKNLFPTIFWMIEFIPIIGPLLSKLRGYGYGNL